MNEIALAVFSLLGMGGGLTVLTKFALDWHKEKANTDMAEDAQLAKRSEIQFARLDSRVVALETEVKDCRADHANCREENGYLRGRVEELSIQQTATTARIDAHSQAPAIAAAAVVAAVGESGAHKPVGLLVDP